MARAENSIISSNYASLLLRMARAYGISEQEALQNTGLGPVHLEGSSTNINGLQFIRLVKNTYSMANNSAMPVHYGLHISIATHGMLGFGLLSSATIGDAFDLALRFYKTIFSILTIDKEVENNTTRFIFDYEVDLQGIEPIVTEGIFSGLLSISRFVMGYPVVPHSLCFQHAKPEHAHLYSEVFDVTPKFKCQNNEIILDQETLNLALPAYDPQTRKMAEQQCEAALQTMEDMYSLPEKIKQLIKSNPRPLPSLTQVAESFNMHPRTLGRRLKNYDTCFKDLLDEVREDLAMKYLADPKMLIDEIAYLLDYQDTTSFYRAFKRWTGASPGQYRPKTAINEQSLKAARS